MFDKAIQFLKDHKEIALATSEGNLPKLRIFLTLPLLPKRLSIVSYVRIPMLRYWHTLITFQFAAQEW